MGRVNFGPDLLDRKGIVGGVLFGEQYLFDWTVFPLPLDNLSRLAFKPSSQPAGRPFTAAAFTVTERATPSSP